VRVFDAFLFNNELDMLECRLTELDSTPIYRHILVEAPWDHHGKPKPLHYADNANGRFGPWKDRIVHIVADETHGWQAHPWAREHVHRSWTWDGLGKAGTTKGDTVLICDVDEIPSPAAVACRPKPFISLAQRFAAYAVDWLVPVPWQGAVAARADAISCFTTARDGRGMYPVLDDGGWHLTWLGGPDAIRAKAKVMCHLELYAQVMDGATRWYRFGEAGAVRHGVQQEGVQHLIPVDVDETWPQWIYKRRCPPEWFRPRY